MLSIPIHKDPFDYQKKVIGGLTPRMLMFIVIGVGCAIAMGLYISVILGYDPTSTIGQLLIMCVGAPPICCAFVKPYGLPFEDFVRLFLRSLGGRQRIYYVSTPALNGFNTVTIRSRNAKVDKSYRKLCGQDGIELWEPDGERLQ